MLGNGNRMEHGVYENILKRGRIGNVELRNRTFHPAAQDYNSPDGTVPSGLVQFCREEAQGGFGLVVTGLNDPSPYESPRTGHPDVSTDDCIPGLCTLAQTIHDNGAKGCLQLAHLASHALPRNEEEYGWHCVSLEGISAEYWLYSLYPELGGKPLPHTEYTVDEIHELVGQYGDAALRAKIAGFDMVEVHCANMHGLNLFTSALSNKRTDEYGGPVGNRARAVYEIFEDIQRTCGKDFPVIFRLSAEDLVPGGTTLEETLQIAHTLEDMGAAAIDVVSLRSGTGMQVPEIGENLRYSARFKQELHIPVMVAGTMNTPELCDEAIASGAADFVGTARAAYADPAWPRKVLEQRPEDIRPCIRCNECMNTLRYSTNGPLVCTMNPRVGKEDVLPVVRTDRPAKVAVIGGGPAGMEAALVADARGHEVTLFEKCALGGLVNEASVPSFKQDLKRMLTYFETQLGKSGVEVRMEEATPQKMEGFDAAIVCTGSKRATLPIPGFDGPNVVNAIDVLGRDPELPEELVVVGGGSVGVETALFEAMKGGHKVTVVEMLDHILDGENIMTVMTYQGMLEEQGVTVLTSTAVEAIGEDGVTVRLADGSEQKLPAGRVITAVGLASDLSVRDEMDGVPGLRVYYAGDCESPKLIFDAIHAGFAAGCAV